MMATGTMIPMVILKPELRPSFEILAEAGSELRIAPAVTGILGLTKAIMELIEGSGLSYKGVFAFRVFEFSSLDWSELTLLDGR